MFCPDCGQKLINIGIKTKEGERLEVEYCPSCAGFWLDHFEANKISFKNARELVKKLQKPSDFNVGNGSLQCPRCKMGLETLRGENVPLNCPVLFCPKCQGNWFPKGQLLAFKKAQEVKLAYLKAWQIPIASAFSVLLPVFILAIISISIPLTVYLVQKRQEQRIEAQGMVNNLNIYYVSKTAVLIAWQTTEKVKTDLEYGTNSLFMQKLPVSISKEIFHQITLRNLKPGATYYYRIILYKGGKALALPLGSFKMK